MALKQCSNARHCRVSAWAGAYLASALLTSCIAAPNIVEGDHTRALLDAYRQQTEQSRADRDSREAQAIRRLQVTESPNGSELLLTVDLADADLNRVIHSILEDPRVQFQSESVQFSGRVSARFHNQSLLEGLSTLIEGQGSYVENRDGVYVFKRGYAPTSSLILDDNSTSEGELLVSQEVKLKHISAEDVALLIEDLFPENDLFENAPVSVGVIAELNAIYISGSPDMLNQAISVINWADRPVAHVIIEALVVNIDTSTVESIGLQFADGASGKFSASQIIPGLSGGNIVTTFSDLAENSASVTATIDFLAAQNAAEVLARPYLATRSTQVANIEIVDDQFVRVNRANDDSSIVSTSAVTAGITMQITPMVMADNAIRVDIELEDSRFSVTAGDILITKQRNSASTSMIVNSGQTIMIGGLNSRYRITEHGGLPWLRKVPILNVFAGEQGAIETRSQLVVYLTPYIWVPGLDVPLPLYGTPDAQSPDWVSMERGGRSD